MLGKVHAPVRLDPSDEGACHVGHVGRDAPNFGHIELGGQVEGVRVAHRIPEQVRIELLQDVGQRRRVAVRPLAADAPA